MNTDLAMMQEHGSEIQQSARIDYATLEKLVAQGDLKGLTPVQRVSYYQARCVACGLDPASQPFEYLTFQGKLILYARKTATDQLTRLHRISLSVVSREYDTETGLYEVTFRATFPDGRVNEDVGAMVILNLKGDALAVARMKTVTKAKRRTVLAACGLGMLDESEVGEVEQGGGSGFVPYGQIEGPKPGKFPDQGSGHGRTGSYASPKDTDAFAAVLNTIKADASQAWDSLWLGCNPSIPCGLPETPYGTPHLIAHLFKHAVLQGKLKPVEMTTDPETGKPVEKMSVTQKRAMVAIVWGRESDWLHKAIYAFIDRESRIVARKFASENPNANLPPDFDYEEEPENVSQTPPIPDEEDE